MVSDIVCHVSAKVYCTQGLGLDHAGGVRNTAENCADNLGETLKVCTLKPVLVATSISKQPVLSKHVFSS